MWLYKSGLHPSAITVPSIFHSSNETKYNLRSFEPIRSAIAKHQRKRHPTQSNSIPGTMLDDSNQVKAIKNRGEEMHFDLLYQTAMKDIMFCNNSEGKSVQPYLIIQCAKHYVYFQIFCIICHIQMSHLIIKKVKKIDQILSHVHIH